MEDVAFMEEVDRIGIEKKMGLALDNLYDFENLKKDILRLGSIK